MKVLLMILFSVLLLGQAKGQLIQAGVSGTIATTFFHKQNSEYDTELFRSRPRGGIGLSLPVILNLTNNISLQSGIKFQNKKYHFEQHKFNFPEVEEGYGSLYIKINHLATEIPLLFCYRLTNERSEFMPEIKMGAVFVRNAPKAMTIGYRQLKYNGSDSLYFSSRIDEPVFSSTYSTDLYLGISIIKTKEKMRHQELTLSYQYGLGQTTTNYFFTELMSPATPMRILSAKLSPRLSYIGITYNYFPPWLAFKKKKSTISD
jgi:hypothetical protein